MKKTMGEALKNKSIWVSDQKLKKLICRKMDPVSILLLLIYNCHIRV